MPTKATLAKVIAAKMLPPRRLLPKRCREGAPVKIMNVAAVNKRNRHRYGETGEDDDGVGRASDGFECALRTHKFRVGQTVSYTSSPISRPGASGSYQVVRLLPSDGDDYQYRIKNPGEAFERVAKESQLTRT